MKKIIIRVILVAMVLSMSLGIFTACYITGNDTAYSNSKYFDSVNFSFESADGEKKTLLIHLDLDGGYAGDSSAVTVGKLGEKIEGLPLKIIKTGFAFSGWYTALGCSGYQIADQNGIITDRSILNSDIYGLTEESETLTLYAGWIREKVPVSLILESQRYTVEIEYGSYLNSITLSNGATALSYSVNPSGYPLYQDPITNKIDLYVISYEKTFTGRTISCEMDKGFNPKAGGTSDSIRLHAGWNLGEIQVDVKKTADFETNYIIKYRLLQDISHLPKNGLDNVNDCWLENDTYSQKIFNTNIKNQRVGYGAYFLKVYYKNGKSQEFNDTNFLSNLYQYENVELCTIDVKATNPIDKIEISLVYEIRWNNRYSYWLGVSWLANYRCDFEIKI